MFAVKKPSSLSFYTQTHTQAPQSQHITEFSPSQMQLLYRHDLAPHAPVCLPRNGEFAINGWDLYCAPFTNITPLQRHSIFLWPKS